MMKAFKYRLYPTAQQADALQFTLDRNRELYNAALEERREAWRMSRVSVTYAMQSAQLPDIKEIRPEYKEIYSQVLQDTLKRVDKAFKAFFKRVKEGNPPGFPRFQGYDRYDSFTYPQGGFSLTHENRVCLSKIGSIKVKLHRGVQGSVKTCTIKREGACWYGVFACEVELQPHLPSTDEAVGIDLGLLHFATLSTGDTIENPRHYRKAEKKVAKVQQEVSRKKRGSHRRKKAVARLSQAYRNVRNQRNDHLHQWSHRLVNTYEVLVFEDIKPANLSKRPAPKQDEEGKYLPNGASAKAGLNKSILDAGWSQFILFCEYKAACAGTHVMRVDPKYTSQMCSGCGAIQKKELDERWHSCSCGCELDRDHNAAINILRIGLSGEPLRPKRSQARTEPSEDAPLRSPAIHG